MQVCDTHGREDLVNATITLNAEEEELQAKQYQSHENLYSRGYLNRCLLLPFSILLQIMYEPFICKNLPEICLCVVVFLIQTSVMPLFVVDE